MGWRNRLGTIFIKRASAFIAAKALLSLVVLVAAVNIVITPHTNQALVGGHLSVTNGLTAVDKGFAVEPSPFNGTGTCPVANVTFSPTPGTATTAIVSGHYAFTVQVGTTGSTAPFSCFTATLVMTPSGGNQTTYGPVSIANGSNTSGQTIDCRFDVGSSLPASPYTFKVTVQ